MTIYRAVLAVDRYELLADARSMINHHRNLLLAGEAAVGIELINLLETVPAEVAIIALAAPNPRKIGVIKTIAERHPGLKTFLIRNRKYMPRHYRTTHPPWWISSNNLNELQDYSKHKWRYS